MHLSLPILLSLLPLTTLAHPLTNTTTALLTKRDKKPYIISYPDPICKGPYQRPADIVEGIEEKKCYTWSPTHKDPHAGLYINYGSWAGKLDSVRFFSDAACKVSTKEDYVHEWTPQSSEVGDSCIQGWGWAQSFKMDYDGSWGNQNKLTEG